MTMIVDEVETKQQFELATYGSHGSEFSVTQSFSADVLDEILTEFVLFLQRAGFTYVKGLSAWTGETTGYQHSSHGII